MSAPDENGWMPIGTAPRNRPILTYRRSGFVAVAEYMPEFGAGWCITGGMNIVNVTHWQPLPSPPITNSLSSTPPAITKPAGSQPSQPAGTPSKGAA